ncbi:MAG: lipid-binding SYLF domain-containing protein [Alphaproteobacteria bacterium]|nr:lipid-binding SYLF domain-containing protein [Alphaproteobacteria bacterium]
MFGLKALGRWRSCVGLAILLGVLVTLGPRQVQAQEAQILIDRARTTVEEFRLDADMGSMRILLARAKAVLIIPQLLKAGFIIGGEGGNGVLLTRRDGRWSAPAFYSFGAGSVGLQIGAQASEVMLLLMTDRAVDAVLRNRVTLGGDASVAAGPLGRGVEAATTTNFRADVYAYSRTKGLFAGASLEGAVLTPLDNANATYYGQRVSARDILMNFAVDHAGANALRGSLDATLER